MTRPRFLRALICALGSIAFASRDSRLLALEATRDDFDDDVVREMGSASDSAAANFTEILVNISERIIDKIVVPLNPLVHRMIPDTVDLSNDTTAYYSGETPTVCIIPNPFGGCLCEAGASYSLDVQSIDGLDSITFVPDVTVSIDTGNAVFLPVTASISVHANVEASVGACGLDIRTSGTLEQPIDVTATTFTNLSVHVDDIGNGGLSGVRVDIQAIGLAEPDTDLTFQDPIVNIDLGPFPVDLTGLLQNVQWGDKTRGLAATLTDTFNAFFAEVAPTLLDRFRSLVGAIG
jgi:hypothetical protein